MKSMNLRQTYSRRAWLACLLAVSVSPWTFRCPGGTGAPPESSPSVRRTHIIKVLSYNIHGLPSPFVRDFGQFTEIGRILAERRTRADQPDFVLLQESFSDATAALRTEAHYPHLARGPEAKGNTSVNSGLFILSEHPLLSPEKFEFNDCAVDDCMAAKGVLTARVQPAGMPEAFLVFTTHLQAQSEEDHIRMAQIDQMTRWFTEKKVFSFASIFGGDFNFKPGKHPSYAHFAKQLPFVDVGKKAMEVPAGCTIEVGGLTDVNDISKSANDRQFIYTPSGSRYQIRPIFITRNFTSKLKGQRLSDHWGYEVHYEFSWLEQPEAARPGVAGRGGDSGI
jgi:endonuclease/exonuclease/phosphatase family metal-dependent hydrolase